MSHCPSEDDLLPLATEQGGRPALADHLASCPACRDRLAKLRAEVAALRQLSSIVPESPTATRSEAFSGPQPYPAVIGKYFLVGSIKWGNEQACAYRAVHPMLNRDVVFLRGSLPVAPSHQARQRLIDEAARWRELEHPHLVRVLDLVIEEDCPYLVVDSFRGPSLADLSTEAWPSPRQAACIVAKVARALAAAHARGLAHQNVSPRVVLIDETGEPRLTLLGLAGVEGAAAVAGRPMTDALAGDVFALGLTLLFLLAKSPPVLHAAHLNAPSAWPTGQPDLRSLQVGGLPRGLAAICRKALQPRPQDRYAHATEFADALERWLARPQRMRALVGGLLLLTAAVAAWGIVRLFSRP